MFCNINIIKKMQFPITPVIRISNLQTPYNISQAELDIVVLWSNPLLVT